MGRRGKTKGKGEKEWLLQTAEGKSQLLLLLLSVSSRETKCPCRSCLGFVSPRLVCHQPGMSSTAGVPINNCVGTLLFQTLCIRTLNEVIKLHDITLQGHLMLESNFFLNFKWKSYFHRECTRSCHPSFVFLGDLTAFTVLLVLKVTCSPSPSIIWEKMWWGCFPLFCSELCIGWDSLALCQLWHLNSLLLGNTRSMAL